MLVNRDFQVQIPHSAVFNIWAFSATFCMRCKTKVPRFSTNVLKARHFGFTPHAKGGRKGPNVENRRVGDLNLEIPVNKPSVKPLGSSSTTSEKTYNVYNVLLKKKVKVVFL